MKCLPVFVALLLVLPSSRGAQQEPTPGDRQLARYFEIETSRIEAGCLNDLTTAADWKQRQQVMRGQLAEMLGLSPMPEKTDLKVTVTGRLDHPEFTVENLHYQSMPGLYVTANLYLPKNSKARAPAVLYVCGHGQMKTNGVSLGNKTAYQHHGEWFARHGYVCLTIDTIQLGELEGVHHGTKRMNMWWWNARGYTPAGVEAWNGIRGIDLLQSRPEVDPERIGVTGRSGGGAYSWWVAALDERVKAAAPVAGITDLRNHVVDGVVQGHCDCMFMVNTHRWDYAQVAALVAPRPLLICNSDKDSIFPLDGVQRIHAKVRDVYRLLGAEANLGLLITEGPHKDTQELQVPVFRWFNRHLKGAEPLITVAAEKLLAPAQLKVLHAAPADQRTTTIHETFVPAAAPMAVPQSREELDAARERIVEQLRAKSFHSWPAMTTDFAMENVGRHKLGATQFLVGEFNTQDAVRLRLYAFTPDTEKLRRVVVRVLDNTAFPAFAATVADAVPGAMADEVALMKRLQLSAAPGLDDTFREETKALLADGETAVVFFTPRGLGMDTWNPPPKYAMDLPRRFQLLGQTVEAMRAWDILALTEAIRSVEAAHDADIEIRASGALAVDAAYAVLMGAQVERLTLQNVPASHRTGPDYLNVLKLLDVPEALALCGSFTAVEWTGGSKASWQFPLAVAAKLGWSTDRFQFRE